MGAMGSHRHDREPHAHPDVDAQEREILTLLRSEGGRVTTGRRAIVRALLTGPDHHVTAEDVARMVQVEHPDVHVSTVYRTLDSLEAHGVVERVNLSTGGGGSAIYHLTDHTHHHLVCEQCGAVVELPPDGLADLAASVAERHGFELAGRHQVLSGLCADCRVGSG
jgi:Fur family transcriptional regulator, ferric uptake regulator